MVDTDGGGTFTISLLVTIAFAFYRFYSLMSDGLIMNGAYIGKTNVRVDENLFSIVRWKRISEPCQNVQINNLDKSCLLGYDRSTEICKLKCYGTFEKQSDSLFLASLAWLKNVTKQDPEIQVSHSLSHSTAYLNIRQVQHRKFDSKIFAQRITWKDFASSEKFAMFRHL